MNFEHIFDDTQTAFAAKTDLQLAKARLLFQLFGVQPLVNFGSAFTSLSMAIGLPISPLYKYSVYNHFCGGETFAECKKTIKELDSYNVGSMLNYGVELKETEADFEKTILHTIEAINFAAENHSVKSICTKITGFGRFAMLEKVHAKEKLNKEEEKEFNKIKQRLNRICKTAHEKNVVLYIDAEESWIQDPLDEMVDEMMQAYNKESAIIYNTYQLYRSDRLSFLKKSYEASKKQGYILGAKIVRGAYMEKERERAEKLGYPSPIHENKNNVDKDFNEAVEFCLQHLSDIAVCIASQSEESNRLAIKLMQRLNIPLNHSGVYFSQLYGMGDNITFNLAKLGCNACKYLPYGPVKDVIPYLIRRAQENSSISGQMGRELNLINTEIKRRKKC
jgi:proline dehydrogenase